MWTNLKSVSSEVSANQVSSHSRWLQIKSKTTLNESKLNRNPSKMNPSISEVTKMSRVSRYSTQFLPMSCPPIVVSIHPKKEQVKYHCYFRKENQHQIKFADTSPSQVTSYSRQVRSQVDHVSNPSHFKPDFSRHAKKVQRSSQRQSGISAHRTSVQVKFQMLLKAPPG